MQAQGRSVHKLITLLALLPCLVLANEQTLSCYVVGVSDGDTLSCFDAENRKTEKIRLRGIDAPEAKQPFGQRSKQSLSSLAHGQPATVKWSKRDRWGRIIGAVWVEPVGCPGCGHVSERVQVLRRDPATFGPEPVPTDPAGRCRARGHRGGIGREGAPRLRAGPGPGRFAGP